MILGLDLSFWGPALLGLVELTESDVETADCEEHRNDEDDDEEEEGEVVDRLDEVLEEPFNDDNADVDVADGDDDDGDRFDGPFNDAGADTDDDDALFNADSADDAGVWGVRRDDPDDNAITGCPKDDDEDDDDDNSANLTERRGNPELR